jgi:hypothetical protein
MSKWKVRVGVLQNCRARANLRRHSPGLRHTNLDILSIDKTNLGQEFGTEISGTLGFPPLVLLDMKIDYRDRLVSLKFDPPSK